MMPKGQFVIANEASKFMISRLTESSGLGEKLVDQDEDEPFAATFPTRFAAWLRCFEQVRWGGNAGKARK